MILFIFLLRKCVTHVVVPRVVPRVANTRRVLVLEKALVRVVPRVKTRLAHAQSADNV